MTATSHRSRVVFFGTPAAATVSLQALVERAPALQVVGVVTRAPQAVGRKQVVTPSPVHAYAAEHGIPVATPVALDEQFVQWLRDLSPDVAVLTVYGKILPPAVLAVPPLGFVNVHPSLLPKHRGPSPIVSSIVAGDHETGVTLIVLDREVDHGPILAQRSHTMPTDATGGSLTQELAQVGAELLVETLPSYLAGALQPRPQDHSLATVSTKLSRESGVLDWSQPAALLERTIRAYSPWPATYTCLHGKRLKVLMAAHPDPADAGTSQAFSAAPGTVAVRDSRLLVATGEGLLELKRVQLEGAKPTSVADFVRGHAEVDGARLLPC